MPFASHHSNFTDDRSLKGRNVVYAEQKICEQGSSGCQQTFVRAIGSRRVVCDACLLHNIELGKRFAAFRANKAQSASTEERKEFAWEGIKRNAAMERNAEHIGRVCLRKFAFATRSAALRVAEGRKTRHTHKNQRKMQVFRCEFQIHDSVDEARRGQHYHVGGDHEDFAGSAF